MDNTTINHKRYMEIWNLALQFVTEAKQAENENEYDFLISKVQSELENNFEENIFLNLSKVLLDNLEMRIKIKTVQPDNPAKMPISVN